MYVLNSTPSDDTDVTIINPSLLYDGNDEPISSCIPIVRRLQQANQLKSVDNPRNPDDNLFDTVKLIEQILNYYRQDLKQESNEQIDCNRQLITRLVDFIRPVYSSNEEKMKNLDNLYEDISILHDKRFLEQKEKHEQLHNKIRHLKHSLITTPIEDDDRNSLMTNLYRMNTMFDYEEWNKMEEEIKNLQYLVLTQNEQIDKLTEILNQTDNIQVYPINPNSLNLSIQQPSKKCSVCNYEFPIIYSETDIINHVEKCIPKPNVPMESKLLECPYCNENLSQYDNLSSIQHLSQCFNEMTGNF